MLLNCNNTRHFIKISVVLHLTYRNHRGRKVKRDVIFHTRKCNSRVELKTTLSQISQKFIFKASYWVLFIKKKSRGSFYKNRPNKLSSNVQIINMLHTVLHLHYVTDSGLLFFWFTVIMMTLTLQIRQGRLQEIHHLMIPWCKHLPN